MITKQEMFNRAYVGLKSQGFTRCGYRATDDSGNDGFMCTYSDEFGKHCAWGWVDTSLNSSQAGAVYSLREDGIGLAADLRGDLLDFAQRLQLAHDESATPERMISRLNSLAQEFCLEIPNTP